MWSFKSPIFDVADKKRTFDFIISLPDKIEDYFGHNQAGTIFPYCLAFFRDQISFVALRFPFSKVKLINKRIMPTYF